MIPAAEPATDFGPLIEAVARKLWGEPNKALSKPDALRWGNQGAKIVYPRKGAFKDCEADTSGGTLDLIQQEQRTDKGGAVRSMIGWGLIPDRAREHAVFLQPSQRITATFEYRKGGTIHYRKHRVEPGKGGRKKDFAFDRPGAAGGWQAGRGDVAQIPYRADSLAGASVIVMAEGEAKADRLAAWGFAATSSKDWRPDFAEFLRDKHVIILPDNDTTGATIGDEVKAKALKAGATVAIVSLPGLADHGDILNWEGTADDLRGLINAARDVAPVAAPAANDDAGRSPGERPQIHVRAGALHVIATEAESALIAAGAPLYVRGGVVRPVVDEMPAAHGRVTKVARLCPVDGDAMVDHLSRAADFVKFNVRKNGFAPADPPHNVAATILSRDGEWRFPRLAGVITTPTLRPDGTILSEPGYDPQTQLLLMDPPSLPPIPERPTRDNALAALRLLDSLLDEFPFVDDASRSVGLSCLITPVVRGAMSVAPLHGISAPAPGSGKSYIVDTASGLSNGDRAPVIAVGRTEEETEKRLASALLNGQSIVSIDNVNGELGGDFVCQMIERPVVSVRPLGVSKLVKIESRATCFATGNNIQMVGDMVRRTVLCSLDPKLERPELRQFSASPFDLVLSDRGKYVAAALTIARAYSVAGYPDMLPALASFEQWSRVVRSAIVWLGHADPCETMTKARGDDPVIAALSGVLAAWHGAVGASWFTAGAIKEEAEKRDISDNLINGALLEALQEVADDRRGGVNARSLGRYLGQYRGRIANGFKIVDGENSHTKQRIWKVVGE